MSHHWRVELNNICQRYDVTQLVWHDTASGPANAPTWTAHVLVRGEKYGCGSARTTSLARELAAEQAVRRLWSELG
ncbi:hypothetical protein C2E23DRAFT_849559 [Lenzites betulinus]|nr:hypothetical protein C2E23DRAFT_849559 [Lenzites betulinus]